MTNAAIALLTNVRRRSPPSAAVPRLCRRTATPAATTPTISSRAPSSRRSRGRFLSHIFTNACDLETFLTLDVASNALVATASWPLIQRTRNTANGMYTFTNSFPFPNSNLLIVNFFPTASSAVRTVRARRAALRTNNPNRRLRRARRNARAPTTAMVQSR